MSSPSHSQDKLDQYFNGLMQAHSDLITKLKGLIVQKQPMDPGAFLDEYISGSTSPLVLTPQIDRPILVEYIIVSYTPLAAATLVIGKTGATNRTIPIVATTNNMPIDWQCAMVLLPGDSLTLTVGGATSLFLEIMGKSLSGTDWSTF